jgi:hypothetical protein
MEALILPAQRAHKSVYPLCASNADSGKSEIGRSATLPYM